MTEQILTILQSIYDKLEGHVKTIFLSGSSTCSYIKHPHDIDIFIYMRDRTSILKCARQVETELKQIKTEIPSAAVIFSVQDRYEILFNGDFEEKFNEHPNRYGFLCYLYEFPLIQVLVGEDEDNLRDVNIFKQKEKVIVALKYFMNKNKESNKFLYHILTTLYILQNNSYELTEEQINNINIAHDEEDKESIAALYQWAKAEVEKL